MIPRIRFRLVLSANSTNNACDYYRSVLPYRHLAKPLAELGIDLVPGQELDPKSKEQYDVVHLMREHNWMLLSHVSYKQSLGVKVVYDLDDDLLHVPEWSPAHYPQQEREGVTAFRMLADRCWVTTPPLAEAMTFEHAKTPVPTVLPNLIDLDDWGGGSEHPSDTDKIRLCWAGSNTHGEDLRLVEKPLYAILNKYQQVELHCMGDCPPKWALDWPNRVFWHPFGPLSQYPARLRAIRPHVGFCPLTNCEFNRRKSCIKYLEMVMAGAFVVSSDIEPYQGLPTFGCLSDADWYQNLEQAIVGHENRRDCHWATKCLVIGKYSWQKSEYVKDWFSAFIGVASTAVRTSEVELAKARDWLGGKIDMSFRDQ